MRYRHFSQSPLLTLLSSNQQLEADNRGMNYGVTVVKLPALYDFCRDKLLREGDSSTPDGWKQYYRPIDPAPWGAEEAYQEYREDMGLRDSYLLCYPDRIVSIGFDWTPTQKQMDMVAEKLGGK